jgi:hypothetical protein
LGEIGLHAARIAPKYPGRCVCRHSSASGKLPRQQTVLERVAKLAGYFAAPAAGEVSGTADKLHLERRSIVADCGTAIHPDQVAGRAGSARWACR